MKNVIAGLVLALTPTVALAEDAVKDSLLSDIRDIGVLLAGDKAGCGYLDYEASASTLQALEIVLATVSGTSLTEAEVLSSSQVLDAGVTAMTFISENSCFSFNTYVVEGRFEMNTVDDVFELYIPTSNL